MDETMARKGVFPFMILPCELRFRVYDFLGLVHDAPLSIHDILEYPEIIRKMPKALAMEMLDMYMGNNRFSINCHIGLDELLAASGDTVISKIRHLRLVQGSCTAHEEIAGNGLVIVRYPLTYDMDVDILRDVPWFNIRFVRSHRTGYGCQDEVLFRMRSVLHTLVPSPSDNASYLGTRSLRKLVNHWVTVKRV